MSARPCNNFSTHSLVANRAAEIWTTLLSCILQFPARNHGPVLIRRWTYHCTWYQINFSRYPGHLGSTHYENHCPLELAPLVLAVWWVQRLQDHSHVKLPPVRERTLSCESWPAWSRGFTWKLRVCSILGAALFCFKKRESKHPPPPSLALPLSPQKVRLTDPTLLRAAGSSPHTATVKNHRQGPLCCFTSMLLWHRSSQAEPMWGNLPFATTPLQAPSTHTSPEKPAERQR